MNNYDGKSIEDALNEYSHMVYNIALKFMGNEHDAKDVAQDSLIKAYINRDKFKQNSKFSSYLYSIAVNTSKDALRVRQKKLKYQEDISKLKVQKDILSKSDHSDDPLAKYERQELLKSLRLAINQLSPDYKEVLIYRHYLDFSYSEVSEQLGISEGTVKSRLHRAKQQLRLIMQESVE